MGIDDQLFVLPDLNVSLIGMQEHVPRHLHPLIGRKNNLCFRSLTILGLLQCFQFDSQFLTIKQHESDPRRFLHFSPFEIGQCEWSRRPVNSKPRLKPEVFVLFEVNKACAERS